MYEIKVGKLMVQEVVATRQGKGEVFEFVNINDYTDKELSAMGKALIDRPELFISFMDTVNPESHIETTKNKPLVDYSKYEKKALIAVFGIVDDLTLTKSEYYFDEDFLQYKKSIYEVELNNELNKLVSTDDILFYVKLGERYQDIVDDMNSSKHRTILLEKFGKALRELDNSSIAQINSELTDYKLGEIESVTFETDEILYSVLDSVIKDNFKKDFYYKEDDRMWINIKNLSISELGKLAYNYMKNSYDYKNIDEKDIKYIKDNFDLVWNNISDSDKDFLKSYLVDCSDFAETELWTASEKLQPVIDELLTEKLHYYYISDGNWEKLSKLGIRIWNIALKYHNKFRYISEIIEEDEKVDSYMSLLAKKSISTNNGISEYDINNLLDEYMKKEDIQNYSDWSYKQWKEEVCTDCMIYKTMLSSLEDVIKENFNDCLEFDKNNDKWIQIERKKPKSEVEISYKSDIKVVYGYNDLACNRYMIECIIPYVDFDEKYKVATSLEYYYDESSDKFNLTNNNIKSFIGVDSNMIELEIDKLCREYGFDVPEEIPF